MIQIYFNREWDSEGKKITAATGGSYPRLSNLYSWANFFTNDMFLITTGKLAFSISTQEAILDDYKVVDW